MSSSSFEAPTLEALAQLLPAYEFEAFIAQGGMGAVYKARQRSLDRDVAIKILPRELSRDPEFKESFETEARAMARLNHPNLIAVYDSGEIDGMLYIVMELVHGKPLYYSAYNTAIDPHQAAEIVKGICDGLAHAHEHGIIHRDIKPANILLTPKREPKIGDFGLARPVEAEGPGLIMGTPGYAAPELTEQPELADQRSDIFAVGVILYELLTGHRPDQGSGTPSQNVGCDRDLDVICHLATHPDPAQRYSDAGLMAKALDEWMKKPVAAGPRKLVAAAPRTAIKRPAAGPAKPITVKGVRKPATPRPANTPGVPPAPGTPAPIEVGSTGNWTLVRNLVIIAVLLITIAATWKHLQRTKGEREQANLQIQIDKANKEAQAAAAAAALANQGKTPDSTASSGKPNPKPVPVVPPVPEPEPETPAESLARLRSALAAGERDEMPVGAARHGSTDFLLIPDPMTWQEAAEFAAAHGGHLPLVNGTDDLSWIENLVPDDLEDEQKALWIGAGRSGRDSWALVDGTPWPLEKKPVGSGQFLAVNDVGTVKVKDAKDRFPFVIQWQRDGSNPASLEAVLERTRESLDKPVPLFPPGTLAYEARHVLVVLHEATFDEAVELAELAGGHLAVPASRDEAGWLDDQIAGVSAADGLWIGGVLDGTEWKWSTGEAWSFAHWADGYPTSDGSTLLVFPGQGWKDADSEEHASGFIIEWSNDRESASAAPPVNRNPSKGGDLISKSRTLLAGLEKERQAKLADNAKKLVSDLDTWLRRQNGSENTRWSPEVESIKLLIEGNRVPEKIDRDTGIRLSPDMAKFCQYAVTKQKEHDAKFTAAATNIRDAYVARLTSAREDAETRGQAELVKALDEQIEEAADVEAWVESLSGKQAGSGKAAEAIVGDWLWGGKKDMYSFSKDGTASAPWDKGTWTGRTKDGVRLYKVSWNSGYVDEFTVSKNGKSLEGGNNRGGGLSAVRFETAQGGDSEDSAPLIGTWAWFSGATVVIEPGGVAINETRDAEGTWKAGDANTYVITWDGGDWIDTVLVSKDLRSVHGWNQTGDKVTATRESD